MTVSVADDVSRSDTAVDVGCRGVEEAVETFTTTTQVKSLTRSDDEELLLGLSLSVVVTAGGALVLSTQAPAKQTNTQT